MEKASLITLEYVNNVIKERPREIHKGQCGRVLVVAGSRGMAGAAVLALRGALKSGAGLVTAGVAEELFTILQIAVPQAVCRCISDEDFLRSLELYDSIAIGPGLGDDEKNYTLVKNILDNYHGKIVIDADGLNAVSRYSKHLDILSDKRNQDIVITPHPGEADRLLAAIGEKSVRQHGRSRAAEILSEATGATVLLKGADTVVTRAGCGTYINTTGNPGMATGGSGDVLTGVIAALLACGNSGFDAARAGAFIHGKAGDIAASRLGQYGMTSVDIEESLPLAFKMINGK